VITDEDARTISLPLSFLGSGKWKVQAWADGKTPTAIDGRVGTVPATSNLILPLAPSGGAALVFSQQ
jgi:alpha-glucosidase